MSESRADGLVVRYASGPCRAKARRQDCRRDRCAPCNSGVGDDTCQSIGGAGLVARALISRRIPIIRGVSALSLFQSMNRRAIAAVVRRASTPMKNPAGPKGENFGAPRPGVVHIPASSRCPQLLARRSFCALRNMRCARGGGLCANEHRECPHVDPSIRSYCASSRAAALCALAYIRARFLILYSLR